MESFRIDLMNGRKVVRTVSVAAQSPVHAVVKTIPKPLMPGKAPGKPWIRVRNAAGGKSSAFRVVD
ncbi:hypothetical protein [Mesorhizobium loti]|uniref:hypothetical protein n=1 Tax=Rhizobium loti TaxID=381 RepID=UPI00040D91C5|nr:hypothetical protein [Mesorhizobium loti]